MAWLRASGLLSVWVMLPQWGCGSTRHDEQSADTGGSSGTSSTTSAEGGTSASGGSENGGSSASGGATTGGVAGSGEAGASAGGVAATASITGSGATGGAGGSSVVSTTGVAAAGGASPVIPIADEREREFLGPLWTDASTLQAASGDALLELARDIALARGYANCRCSLSSNAPPDNMETLYEDCAVAEASPYALGELDDFRCMGELREEVPDFDEQLRCVAANAIENGSSWLLECTDIGVRPPQLEWPSDCPDPTGSFGELQNKCLEAYYCPGGTLGFGSRCDGEQTCSDLSDEFQCFDDVGQDDVLCSDGTVRAATNVCNSACELPLGPNLCLAGSWYYFGCLDGTYILWSNVCDRKSDCPGGEDEAICFR